MPKVHSSGVTSYNHQVTRQEVHIAVQHFKATLSVYFVLKVFSIFGFCKLGKWAVSLMIWGQDTFCLGVRQTGRHGAAGRLDFSHLALTGCDDVTPYWLFCLPQLSFFAFLIYGVDSIDLYIPYTFQCWLDIYGIGCSCVSSDRSSLWWKLMALTKHLKQLDWLLRSKIEYIITSKWPQGSFLGKYWRNWDSEIDLETLLLPRIKHGFHFN